MKTKIGVVERTLSWDKNGSKVSKLWFNDKEQIRRPQSGGGAQEVFHDVVKTRTVSS